MLTDKQISTLKNELFTMKEQAIKTEQGTKPNRSMQESSGELSMYDNHPGDMGTALFEREKDQTLHEQAESEIEKINLALQAMVNGTYGECEVCAKAIPYERLLTIPYTTLCIDHAQEVEQSIDTDTALNEVENPFQSTEDPEAIDYEDSFEEVAEFGTSDSPSDFLDPSNPTYMDDNTSETIINEVDPQKRTEDNENENEHLYD